MYIIKRTSQSCWRYDFYFLVLKTIFHSLAAFIRKVLFLPLENNFFNFVPLCCVYISLKFGNFCHLSLGQALKQGKFKKHEDQNQSFSKFTVISGTKYSFRNRASFNKLRSIYQYSNMPPNLYISCCFLCIQGSFGNWETKET